MNQRIRELYNKVFAESMNMRWNIEDAEKFAELIIRECASACESTTKEGEPLHLVSLGYSQRVKEHFGVEE